MTKALDLINDNRLAEGARLLEQLSDTSDLSNALCQDASRLKDVIRGLTKADIQKQSLWRAVIAAVQSAGRSDQPELIERISKFLGEVQSRDSVLWTDLLVVAQDCGSASSMLPVLAQDMAAAACDEKALWKALVKAAANCKDDANTSQSLAFIDELRNKTLLSVADSMIDAQVDAPGVWNKLVECVESFRTVNGPMFLMALPRKIGAADVQDPSVWISLIEYGESASKSDRFRPGEYISAISEEIADQHIGAAHVWNALLRLAVKTLADQALGAVLLGVAEDLRYAAVDDRRVWKALLEALTRTSICAVDRFEMLSFFTKFPACAASDRFDLELEFSKVCAQVPGEIEGGWSALIARVTTIPQTHNVALAAVVIALGEPMDSGLFKLVLDLDPPTKTLGLIALELENHASECNAIATGLKASSVMTRGEAIKARAAIYAVYQSCKEKLYETFLGTTKPHKNFDDLGPESTLLLLAGLQKSTVYSATHAAMLSNAAGLGKLALDQIPSVASLRSQIRKSATAVNWDVLDTPPTHSNHTKASFCGFPELEKALEEWTTSLRELLLAVPNALMNNPVHAQNRVVVEFGKLINALLVAIGASHVKAPQSA